MTVSLDMILASPMSASLAKPSFVSRMFEALISLQPAEAPSELVFYCTSELVPSGILEDRDLSGLPRNVQDTLIVAIAAVGFQFFEAPITPF